MNKEKLVELLALAVAASVEAGDAILNVYDFDFSVEHKADNSPLTVADKNSHKVIESRLAATQLPLLSEEGRDIAFEARRNWEYFWMIDPLDGTKEFIKRNGEFTVNIALIREHRPVLGVIYVPVKEVLYFAAEGIGAFRIQLSANNRHSDIRYFMEHADKLPLKHNRTSFTVVASRSHLSKETSDFIEKLKEEHGEVEIASMGSSLKLCLVAEGTADIYPRFAPTMEWDTAAGQAIAQAAGKQVVHYQTKVPMSYNKESLVNDWFVVS